MSLSKNQYYTEIDDAFIGKVECVKGSSEVKQIRYYDNGFCKMGFRVKSELFKNMKKAKKYFETKLTL